jgi:hypothetical protein
MDFLGIFKPVVICDCKVFVITIRDRGGVRAMIDVVGYVPR